jgi:hypothetical protein
MTLAGQGAAVSVRTDMTAVFLAIILAGAGSLALGAEVFQDLDEATARIERLKDKPFEKLIDKDGYYQSETLIFRDVGTGAEIWSLTQELCQDLANIERRPVFSSDGSVFSMKGNRAFVDSAGKLFRDRWDGHNFLMEADLTHRRKVWVVRDGQVVRMQDKFDTWDTRVPRFLYYAVEDTLFRVQVLHHVYDNPAEAIAKFPNKTRKILQTIDDDGLLCIQDVNGSSAKDSPLFYVVDLRKFPAGPGFFRSHTLSYGGIKGVEGHDPANEWHVHGIGIDRGSRRVSWNYGPMTDVGEYVSFSVPVDDLAAAPQPRGKETDKWGQYLSHPDRGPGGRAAYFSGPAKTPAGEKGGWGLWVRLTDDAEPIWMGGSAPGGHVAWSGNDPDWFFANVSRHPTWKDQSLLAKIVAGKADGSVLKVLCTPYDRQRGGKAGYDGIPRPNQSPDATKCWFHSSMLMPSDEYTGSYIAVFRRPHAPVAVQGGKGTGTLRWTPHKVSQEVKGVLLYRKGDKGWEPTMDEPMTGLPCIPSPGPGTYMMTSVEWSGLESDTSSPTITLPSGDTGPAVTGWDKTPPSAPTGFSAAREAPGQYRLKWAAPPEKDLRYYNLYFSSSAKPEPVQKRRFASPPRGTAEYLDWTAPTSGAAWYAITAVDRQGNESAPAYASVAGGQP